MSSIDEPIAGGYTVPPWFHFHMVARLRVYAGGKPVDLSGYEDALGRHYRGVNCACGRRHRPGSAIAFRHLALHS